MLRYIILIILFLRISHFTFADSAQPQVMNTSPDDTQPNMTISYKKHWDQVWSQNHFLRKLEANSTPEEIKTNALLSFIIGVGSIFTIFLALISPYFLILFVGSSLIGFILSLSTYRRVKDQPKYRVQRNLALAGLIGSLAIWVSFVLFISFMFAINFISPD